MSLVQKMYPRFNNMALKTAVKGSGRGGRVAIHFMYHNDNGQGYIRMAEGTTPPRHYRHPVYLVLDPEFVESQQLFLTKIKNGVILFHGGIPADFLRLQDQFPTLACNVLRPGRGHMLPPSVTVGTWPADVSYGHVRREKGVGFAPGGPIAETIRKTAWQFMGQEIPQNYGKLVFGFPLTTEVDFDPTLGSVHGLLSEGSQKREELEQNDQLMQNPYERPSRLAGRFQQREEPSSQSEQQRSSSGSSEPREEPPQDDQPEQEATPSHEQVDHTQDDPMGEEVVDLWEAEDVPDEDYVVEQMTRSSISASNPWVLYMRQASFVLDMKMAASSQITMERRSSRSENGHIC